MSCLLPATCQMGPDTDVGANSENWRLGRHQRELGSGAAGRAAASGPRVWLGMAHHTKEDSSCWAGAPEVGRGRPLRQCGQEEEGQGQLGSNLPTPTPGQA